MWARGRGVTWGDWRCKPVNRPPLWSLRIVRFDDALIVTVSAPPPLEARKRERSVGWLYTGRGLAGTEFFQATDFVI